MQDDDRLHYGERFLRLCFRPVLFVNAVPSIPRQSVFDPDRHQLHLIHGVLSTFLDYVSKTTIPEVGTKDAFCYTAGGPAQDRDILRQRPSWSRDEMGLYCDWNQGYVKPNGGHEDVSRQ